MTELSAERQLDVEIAKLIGLNVVALDWPCGYSPESNDYEAAQTHDHPVGGWYNTPGPVFAPFPDGWPPKHVQFIGLCADVEPVPFFSTEMEHALAALEAVKARWRWRIDSMPYSGYEVWLTRKMLVRWSYNEPAATFEALPAVICRVLLKAAGEWIDE